MRVHFLTPFSQTLKHLVRHNGPGATGTNALVIAFPFSETVQTVRTFTLWIVPGNFEAAPVIVNASLFRVLFESLS
ncbi:hypothetical protein Ga0100231_023425 [Opitutaceae bacterium TAV4]|nr:hypothetical protein Ga0100231_023425 [Opitutaceae bacterium TAV4]